MGTLTARAAASTAQRRGRGTQDEFASDKRDEEAGGSAEAAPVPLELAGCGEVAGGAGWTMTRLCAMAPTQTAPTTRWGETTRKVTILLFYPP